MFIVPKSYSTLQKIANSDYMAYLLLGFASPAGEKDGKTEEQRQGEARNYRRVVIRYVNLAIIETLRSVSLKAAKRFPSNDKLVRVSKYTIDTKVNFMLILIVVNFKRNADRGGKGNH